MSPDLSILPTRIGFITGLAAEAALLRGTPFMVEVGGGGVAGAHAAVARLVARGATGLVSFGLAGGLLPGLVAGGIVVPRAVLAGGRRHVCDPALSSWLGGVSIELMLAGDAIAGTAAEKAALYSSTGAAAVDLESGAVALSASGTGMPFAVLRAVSDPANTDLPPLALVALDGQGRILLKTVISSLARRPGQVGPLIRLGRDTLAARSALQKHVSRLAAF